MPSPKQAAPTTAELIAQAAEMIGCGREDSCVTGIRRDGVDKVHGVVGFQAQYAGPEGAEYTVGERPLEARTPPGGGVQCGREDSNLHECYLTRSLV